MSFSRPPELKICGLAAVRSRFQRDPSSIKRLYFDQATGRKIGVICKVLAAGKKIYRCVEPAELEKIADTLHHGGIVAVVAMDSLRAVTPEMALGWARTAEPVLVLDRIGNAHNLGALARTAGFFGVNNLVIPDHPSAARPNDAAYRVAEGGLEHLTVWRVPALDQLCRDLVRAGYEVLGASAHGGAIAGSGKAVLGAGGEAPGRKRPTALVLGNEESGLDNKVAAACTRLVTIPGRGKVESLNVSVAAAVLMWELWGRRS